MLHRIHARGAAWSRWMTTQAVSVRGRRVPLLIPVAAVLAVAGVTSLLIAWGAQHHPPHPSARAATAPLGPRSLPANSPSTSLATPTRPLASTTAPPTTPTGPRASLAPGTGKLVLAASTPVHITVPAIGVSSAMPLLSLNPDGTIQVPPLSRDSLAGWYRFSATPGAPGSAVVLGHIDSAAYGPGVFYRLGALQPGDEIDVTRADHSVAVFRVDRVAEYPKSSFPTSLVYTPTPYASIRLITCGGDFNPQTKNYVDNIIAFGTLVSSRAA